MTTALSAYEAALTPIRRELEQREVLQRLLADDAEAGRVFALLLQWASRSVQLHEPAEQYLAEASRRCAELGEPKLALTMLHIAVDAIDVYRLLADDTRALAQLWNARGRPRVELTSLLTQPASATVRRLHEFHRALVLGPDPWAELAAVFEIQALLAGLADRVIARASALLGDEVRPGLCTLRTLARQGDSSLTRAMAGFLAANPTDYEIFVDAGTRALELYAEFLHECEVASAQLGSHGAPAQRQLA